MYKGDPIMPKPMGNKNIVMPPSRKPKGLGRRNPHSGEFTRKGTGSKHGAAISRGLNKISIFFSGKPLHKPAKPRVSTSPFTKMMNTILRRK